MPKFPTSPETHIFNDSPRCPICSLPADVYITKAQPGRFEGFCERCGDVSITRAAIEEAQKQNKQHLISAWLRRRPASGPPDTLEKETVERILKDIPEYSPLEKLDLTLVQIERKTEFPGQQSDFDYQRDYPLIYAKTHNEAIFYVRQLGELGYVKEGSGKHSEKARMTAKGYQRLSEIHRASRESELVFVAMWFDASMNEAYDEAIEPAVREAGYKAVRIDREQHANRIDDEIIGRIKASRFMVADFTGQRPGVYFEAGMMLGLRRTVIWMCKKRELNQVHFDTRQYNFIDYEDASEAKKRLYDRIIAIEGEGPGLRSTK